jgi:hypothetical protein
VEIIGDGLNPELNTLFPWFEITITISMFFDAVGLGMGSRWQKFGDQLAIVCMLTSYGLSSAFRDSGRGLIVVPIIIFLMYVHDILFLDCWSRSYLETQINTY